MPIRTREATWDGVRVVDAYEWKAGALLEQRLATGRGMFITGTVGTGKSSLAACIARDTVTLPRPDGSGYRSVRWEYVPSMIDELVGMDRKERIRVVQRQINCSLLIWDDFGVDKLSYDWLIGLLDRVVDGRYRARRSMIVTSNLSVGQIASDPALGRITSRWKQTLRALEISGPDRRTPEEDA